MMVTQRGNDNVRVLEDIEKHIDSTRRTLSDREYIELRLSFYKSKKGVVFFKCNDCGRLDYMSYSTWRKRKRCPFCGSGNVVKLSKKEFLELKRKEIIAELTGYLKYLEFLRDAASILMSDDWYRDRLELDGSHLVFDNPSRISPLDRYSGARIYFHWFMEKDFELLDKIIDTARRHGLKLEISIDARPDHCRVSEDVMKSHGFTRTFMGYYVKTVQ